MQFLSRGASFLRVICLCVIEERHHSRPVDRTGCIATTVIFQKLCVVVIAS